MIRRLRSLPILNLARVCVFLTVLSVGTALAGVRWVDAQVNELLHGLGAELMSYPSSSAQQPRSVYVNGARVFLRTTTIEAPVDDVLDHYEAVCDRRDAGLSARLSELVPSFAMHGSVTSRRTGDLRGGHVSCLDSGEGRLGLASLVDRLILFAQTGNSAHVGELRYAYARPMQDDPSHSFLLTMWTEGSVNLLDLLPTDGLDVPGRDPEGLPRPPRVQRILSAWENDEPYGLTLYLTDSQAKESLETFYRREFSKRSWKLLQPDPDNPLVVGRTHVLGFERDGQMLTVLLDDAPGGRETAMVLSTDLL